MSSNNLIYIVKKIIYLFNVLLKKYISKLKNVSTSNKITSQSPIKLNNFNNKSLLLKLEC